MTDAIKEHKDLPWYRGRPTPVAPPRGAQPRTAVPVQDPDPLPVIRQAQAVAFQPRDCQTTRQNSELSAASAGGMRK